MPFSAARHATLHFITYVVQQVELCECTSQDWLPGRQSSFTLQSSFCCFNGQKLAFDCWTWSGTTSGHGALMKICSMAQIAVLVIASNGHHQHLIAKIRLPKSSARCSCSASKNQAGSIRTACWLSTYKPFHNTDFMTVIRTSNLMWTQTPNLVTRLLTLFGQTFSSYLGHVQHYFQSAGCGMSTFTMTLPEPVRVDLNTTAMSKQHSLTKWRWPSSY